MVYYAPYTYSDCLRYVVDCPYYRHPYLEALGYGILFVAAALIATGLVSRGD